MSESVHNHRSALKQRNVDTSPDNPLGPVHHYRVANFALSNPAQPKSASSPTRPRSAPAPRRVGATVSPAKPVAEPRQYGRVNLFEDGYVFLGPQVLRDLEKPVRGSPLRGPDKFLAKGDAKSLRERVKLKERIERHPINRDPPFELGLGGLRLAADNPPSANTMFRRLYDLGSIDFVAVDCCGITNTVRWAQPVSRGRMAWSDAPTEVAVGKWLPIFVDGIREFGHPYRFLAIRGSEGLIEEAGPHLVDIAAELLQPFKKALDTREPTTVAIALQLMTRILDLAPPVAVVWVRALPHWATVFSLFRAHSKMSVDMGYNSRLVANVQQLIFRVVEQLELNGGPDATHLVRKYAPGFDPAVTEAAMARVAGQLPEDKKWNGKPYTLI